MIKIDKKKTPLSVLTSIKSLKDALEEISNKNTALVEVKELDNLLFYAIDRDDDSSFHFRVSDFEQNKSNLNLTEFVIEFSPANDSTLSEYRSKVAVSKVLEKYNHWLTLIKTYNSISLSKEDFFEKKYEEEFIEFFEIVDVDSEIVPFDLKRQLFLNDFLDSAIEILNDEKNQDVEIKALIENAESLKQRLPVLTKKETVRYLSKFCANVRKKSLPLLKKVGSKFVDEIIKRGINWTLDKGSEYLIGFFS